MTDEEINEYRRLQAEGMRNVAIPSPTVEMYPTPKPEETITVTIPPPNKPRKKSLRLTKQQREYQENMLRTFGLYPQIMPNKHLIGQLANALHYERSKSLWTIAGECLRRKRRVW